MQSPVDFDHRLRSAAGEPDPERALGEVLRRIRRRTRRRVLAAGTVVAVAVGLVVVWGVEHEWSHHSSVIVGNPPATTTPQRNRGELRLRQLWSARTAGMSGSFAPSGGRLAVTTDDAVITSEGFGSVGVEPSGRIAALDRARGSVRWTAKLLGPAFLQGAGGGTVIANPEHEQIVGLDATNGTVRWTISLSELGLPGYGAVTSAVAGPISAIGLSADNEGDVRPPVILGVNTINGKVAWRTALVAGTDLNWGTPPVSDGEAVFTSTLSHPGSAEENVAQLVDLTDGSVRWTAGMGGSQGFSNVAAVIDGAHVHLPAYPDVLTVDRADGSRRWTRRGSGAVLAGPELWVIGGDRSLLLLDPDTGDVIRRVDSPIDQPAQLLDLGDDLVGVVGGTEFVAINRDGEVRLTHKLPARFVDVAHFDRGVLLFATADRAIAAYSIETSSTAGATPSSG
jgi:outer membrane protein assembly factor BamB